MEHFFFYLKIMNETLSEIINFPTKVINIRYKKNINFEFGDKNLTKLLQADLFSPQVDQSDLGRKDSNGNLNRQIDPHQKSDRFGSSRIEIHHCSSSHNISITNTRLKISKGLGSYILLTYTCTQYRYLGLFKSQFKHNRYDSQEVTSYKH